MSKLIYPILPAYSIVSLVWVIFAGVIILAIGAINNANIHSIALAEWIK